MQKEGWVLRLLSFALGLTALISQVIVLREFLTVFYGNEMAYAIVLSSWLFWIAVGSLGLTIRASRRLPAMLIAEIFFKSLFFVLPGTVVAIRSIRLFLGLKTGEIVGLSPMVLSAFFVLAPLTIILGALFTLLCRVGTEQKFVDESVTVVNRVYLWESLGAAVGGIILSFILLSRFPALAIMAGLGTVTALASSWLSSARARRSRIISITAVSLLACFVFLGPVSRLDQVTRQIQWQGLTLLKTGDTLYGNIVLVRLKDEISLFENGLLSFSTRDLAGSEEKIHFPLLSHPSPKKVLLIGPAGGGLLKEVLKYPLAQVDLVLLDPQSLAWAKPFLPEEVRAALADPRLKIHFTDGRRMVKLTRHLYDVIIVALGDPYNAQVNRYYTREFFSEAARLLGEEGVFSLSVSSSENYLSAEARDYLRSIQSTLRSVFADVKSIPGETHIFLASRYAGALSVNPHFFITQLKARHLSTRYVSEHYLPSRLSADRLATIERILKKPGQLNTDIHPIVYFFDVTYWAAQFDVGFKTILERLRGVTLWHLLVLPVVLGFFGWAGRQKTATFPLALSLATTGLSEIVFQLMIILAFQTLYGYVYSEVSWIMTTFMAGLVWGSFWAKGIMLLSTERIWKYYRWTQAGMAVYPLFLPLLFIVFRDLPYRDGMHGFFTGTFAALPVLAGMLGGLQYPLATALVRRQLSASKKERTGVTAGKLYAADVFGAALGALVTGTILIPLVGIFSVAVLLASLNVVIWILIGRYPAKEFPDL